MKTTTSESIRKREQGILLMLTHVWSQLTQAHPLLTRPEDRRRSVLLAQMTLTITLVSALASLFLMAREGRVTGTVVAVWFADALTLGIYSLNRRGYFRAGSMLFVGLNFVLIHFAPLLTQDSAWLLFSGMLMIIAATLLPIRSMIVLFIASLAAQIILGYTNPMTLSLGNLGIGIVFTISTLIFLVFFAHRAGLERDQRAALETANLRLRENETALERRVEERTREAVAAKEEAEVARERAERADRVKTRFLGNISHELRTPLNAILNFVEFVTLEMYGPISPEQRDALQNSLSSGQQLLSLINDLLDMTRIDAGMMQLLIEPRVDVHEIVKPVLPMIPTMRGDKPIQFITDIDDQLPPVSADHRRVRQVLLNLLSNAYKFTEHGSVTLSIKHQHPYVLFCVSDTGPGISPSEQEVIFKPFTQALNVEHRLQGGTGLGLAISRWLVSAHEGNLWVESDAGDGAAFFFTIPVSDPQPSDDIQASAMPDPNRND